MAVNSMHIKHCREGGWSLASAQPCWWGSKAGGCRPCLPTTAAQPCNPPPTCHGSSHFGKQKLPVWGPDSGRSLQPSG